MKKSALAALAAIAALSVSACTSGTAGHATAEGAAESATATIAATPTPTATSTPTASPTPPSAAEPTMAKPAPGMESPSEERQFDADSLLNMWLTFEGAHDLDDFHKPYKFIAGWSSPSPGVYAFTIDDGVEDYAAKNGGDVETQLRKIGNAFLANPVGAGVRPKSVHVSTEDGKYETTVR